MYNSNDEVDVFITLEQIRKEKEAEIDKVDTEIFFEIG